MNSIEEYLGGSKLYGDDLSADEILQWYEDEKEGYANLGAKDAENYNYVYHALNTFHSFRHLGENRSFDVLGYGSAYGDELAPIAGSLRSVVVVDPSESFVQDTMHGVPARYIKPKTDGSLDIESGTFDLITCFGVLHHVPNVSAVITELFRTLKPGGRLLLREPIVSMGDWRKPRPGLTKHERGIPLELLRDMVRKAGFSVEREGLCVFPLVPLFFKHFRPDMYNSPLISRLDALLARLFAWNVNYHPRNRLQKFRPTSVFLVLKKNAAKA